MNAIDEIIQGQRRFFRTGATRSIAYRKQALRRLLQEVNSREEEIIQALKIDLNKAPFESVATEISYLQAELKHTLTHLERWSMPERRSASLASFPAHSKVFKDPFGVTLHIAPWNYPFQLSLTPLVSAVAAGNTVVLKPSEYSAKTSALLENMIAKVFEKDHVTVIQGDATVSQELLRHRWDYIFFTGSVAVGKIVAKAAAEYMTPTTLELGGKSPCIVDASAPLDLSARRIVWGKFLNAGQTCIAPDYVLVHKSSYPSFLEALKKAIENAYSQNADQSEDYGRLIHEKHVDRMETYLNEAKVYYGGSFDRNTRYVQPTLITDVTREHQVMQDEIFGPLLPVIPYETEDEIDQWLEELPNPLAFYVFSKNKKWAEELLVKHRFGQAAVNDTIMMIAESNLPFGGVGESGHGVYHAKYGYDTFSREKPVLYRATWLDVPLRYAPFKNKLGALKKLLALNRWLS